MTIHINIPTYNTTTQYLGLDRHNYSDKNSIKKIVHFKNYT